MINEFKVNIYDAPRYLLFLICSLILLTTMFLFLGVILKTPIIGCVGWVIICILPFVFEKRIKNWFTKKYLLEFNNSSFCFSELDKKNDIYTNKITINWNELKSYIFNIDGVNTVLTVYFKESKAKGYCFKEYKTYNDSIKGDSIFNTFYTHVKEYNSDKDSNNKIVYSMGFINSRLGSIIIFTTLFIFIVGFIFHLIIHPQSSILTLLLGAAPIINLFVRRTQYRKMYEEISKLE